MSLQIIKTRYIIPVIPRGSVLKDYALVIKDAKIIDILKNTECRQKYPDANIIDKTRHIVIPGLINAHTHSPMNLLRGLADDLPLMQWLQNHIWPAEQQWVSPQFVRAGTELAIAEMLLSGTTCFNDMYFFPQDSAEVCDQTGIRAVLGQIVIDFPSAYAADADEYFSRGLALYQQYQQHDRIYTALAPHAPYSVNDDNLRRVGQLAQEYALPVHMHVHETRDEIQGSLKQYQMRPLQRLAQLGLLNSQMLAVHMVHINSQDRELVARHKPAIVHCQQSNMKLASGSTPVNHFLQDNLTVCLGTDSVASNNTLDMFVEMKTVALMGKANTANAAFMPAVQVLEMATINAARALGLDQWIGSVEVGKYADLCALDLDHVNAIPLYHPHSHLIYSASSRQVSDVWVHGTQLLDNYQLTRIDTEKLFTTIAKWQTKIQNQ